MRHPISPAALVLLLLLCAAADVPAAEPFPKPGDLAPRRWVVVGTFSFAPGAGAGDHAGLRQDFLADIGGEAGARLRLDAPVPLGDVRLTPREGQLDDGSILDLNKLFADVERTENSVAYAYAEVESPAAARVLATFGSDDSAVVWVNGDEVHRAENAGRMVAADSDRFELELQPGTNRILVKVENGSGGWGFGLRLYDAAAQEQIAKLEVRRHIEALELKPKTDTFYLPETFPELVWADAAGAAIVFGEAKPAVRWFDKDLNEVARPERLGRYVALAESKTVDGHVHRQMLTFVKAPPNAIPRFRTPPFAEPPLVSVPAYRDFDPSKLNDAQRAELSRHVWHGAGMQFWNTQDGAIAVAAMVEMAAESSAESNEPAWLGSGYLRSAQHQLDLRMKLEKRKPRALAAPQRLDAPAPTLRAGSESEAGFKPRTVDKLRTLCAEEWLKDDPNPFVVLVARRGVIVMHEGFGGFEKGTSFAPASIGKSIAGLTFARAVDQGLLEFDQPVGDVLPDFRTGPGEDVTFRWCFNHLVGFAGHASHGGLFNAYLDNALFVQDLVFERPGVRHRYNGDSYNLAGKALELTTGQVMPRLLYEQVQRPFGEDVTQFDLGFGDAFTAMYLAKVGQMLVQDGAYGEHRFFRPGFVKELLPKRVADVAPELNDNELEWGIGLTWMIDPEGPREAGVLGPAVFGHGAASHTVWRVDPAHELVVVIGRNEGKDWGTSMRWAAKFMQIVAEGMAE